MQNNMTFVVLKTEMHWKRVKESLIVRHLKHAHSKLYGYNRRRLISGGLIAIAILVNFICTKNEKCDKTIMHAGECTSVQDSYAITKLL